MNPLLINLLRRLTYNLLILTLVGGLLACDGPDDTEVDFTEDTPTTAGRTSTATAIVDEDSLTITDFELQELLTPAATVPEELTTVIEFVRQFSTPLSLAELRRRVPTSIMLGNPTTEIDIGALPENQIAIPVSGTLTGYCYFQGNLDQIGKLATIELFPRNRQYQGGQNKNRIQSLIKLLGKPISISKIAEDDQGNPLYAVDWQLSGKLLRYQDEEEIGASLTLDLIDSDQN